MTTLMSIQTQYSSMDDASLARQARADSEAFASYIAATSRAFIVITWRTLETSQMRKTSHRRRSWPRWKESVRIAGRDRMSPG